MANTISTDLVIPVLRDAGITKLGESLASLRAYTRDFGTEQLSPRVEVRVPLASALVAGVLVDGGAANMGDASDFEQGDSTITPVKVQVKQYSKSFHIVNRDLQDGLRLQMLAEANAQALGEKIARVVNALMNLVNFPTAPVDVKVSEWGPNGKGIKTLFTALEKARMPFAILDTPLYAEVMFSTAMSFVLGAGGEAAAQAGPAAYGFNGIFRQGLWNETGAASGLAGFGCDPQAIAVASGLPVSPAEVAGLGGLIAQDSFTIANIGLTVQSNVWFSTKTRTIWGSYDVMFGAAVGDSTAGVLVIPGPEV